MIVLYLSMILCHMDSMYLSLRSFVADIGSVQIHGTGECQGESVAAPQTHGLVGKCLLHHGSWHKPGVRSQIRVTMDDKMLRSWLMNGEIMVD